MFVLVFVGGITSFMAIKERQYQLQADQAKTQAERIALQEATIETQSKTMTAAEEMLQHFRDAYFKGHIHEDSSRSMSSLVDQLASKLRSAIHMHQNVLAADLVVEGVEAVARFRADELWINTLNVEADIASNLDDPADALELALEAKETADGLTASHPDNPEALQGQFDSLTRVGDAYMRRLPDDEAPNFDRAIQEYTDALNVAVVGLRGPGCRRRSMTPSKHT